MSDENDLELRAFRVHQPAPQALREVLNSLQTSDFDVFYAIRSRVKPVKAIIEKVRRKRKEGKSDYRPEDITDIVGIRIVTLFREDVIDALKIFLRLIRHQGSAVSPFAKNGLKEGIIYTSAPAGDPEAILSRLRGVFDTFEFPLSDAAVCQVPTGYSSVHLVAFCKVNEDGNAKSVPVEIQIRTVFEDAWGEIDHKLRYSINRGRHIESETLIENWQPHLNVLKSFADGCGQYAGIIKSQAIDARPRRDGSPMVPVDSAEEALKRLSGFPTEVRAAFEAAYAARNAATKPAEASDALVKKRFEEAAELFALAQKTANAQDFTSPEEKAERETAIFFASMERAFCLLSTEKKSAIDEAINIYSSAQDFSPNSSVVYYRYGQALAKLDEFDSAIAKYEKALSLLAADKYIPVKHWIRQTLPLRLGYAIWRKSLACNSTNGDGNQERLCLLKRAFDITAAAADGDERTHADGSVKLPAIRIANNALFYAVEYMSFIGSLDGDQINLSDIGPHLELLERSVDLGTASLKQLSWIDTLCRTYSLTGDTEKAVLAAERIEHLLSAPPTGDGEDRGDHGKPLGARPSYYAITDHLNDRERDVLDHALWVLRQHGPGPERGT